MSRTRTRNIVYAMGLAAVGLGFAYLPIAVSSNYATRGINMATQKEKLGGHQVMRGPYMNSGSSDAGSDPNWVRDPASGGLVFVGKPTHEITEAVVDAFKARGAGAAVQVGAKEDGR